ncbi:hypothetical protein JHK84_032151 [Glycine max]|nr:hypothetical protein JHK87_031857 [Glycine soja]KAG5146608.1 hypothetical protein JHK84_032151 [Glycine max]
MAFLISVPLKRSKTGYSKPIDPALLHPGFTKETKQKKEFIYIYIYYNKKGFAIGNGLTNPEIQYHSYTDYALDMGLLKKADYDSINKLIPPCKQVIEACGTEVEKTCVSSLYACNQIFNQIMTIAYDINYYDIRKKCVGDLCYDFSVMEDFLNNKLQCDNLIMGNKEGNTCVGLTWTSCKSTVDAWG